jgi:hypothetical protein
MHYKACTLSDISFLKSLIAGHSKGKVKLNQKRFRDISVIVGLNTYRDTLNNYGCERFAKEHGTILHEFYSMDTLASPDPYQKTKKGKCHVSSDPSQISDKITPEFQHVLWNLPPEATENHAGKLTLCMDMPVLLKHNIATECCVTNGAEATVAGWKTSKLTENKQALDVLFVKLSNPPKPIQLDGLPLNVVPISCESVKIKCRLPDDEAMHIKREQVRVLPNFSMTDYASQGCTRPNNVVELGSCRTHQGYYTALSRSSSAEGTVIVQGLEQTIISRNKPSSHLRQEFCELELLDEITQLCYIGRLPP